MEIEDKKKIIYDNIFLIDNHKELNNFIIFNNIKYSENNNGLFINITVLSDNIINKLYSIIDNILNNKNISSEQQKIVVLEDKNETKIKKQQLIINDIFLKDFKNDEKIIIKMSKNHKFE